LSDFGVPVADALGLEALADPSRCVAIADDGRQAVPLDGAGDVPDHPFKVGGVRPAGCSPAHNVLDDPPVRTAATMPPSNRLPVR
jgi:hypothetical protein